MYDSHWTKMKTIGVSETVSVLLGFSLEIGDLHLAWTYFLSLLQDQVSENLMVALDTQVVFDIEGWRVLHHFVC